MGNWTDADDIVFHEQMWEDYLESIDNSKNLEQEMRIGLALSGGGFRASFYHIGVLSELARAGLLSKIDVISTVSGGSIIGAYYYLSLQKYKYDHKIESLENKDYLHVVNGVSKSFFDCVSRNIRNGFLISFISDFVIKPKNPNLHRLAELFDRYFFNEFATNGQKNVTLEQFSDSKGLPKLILNSTNVNLGRPCSFTSDLNDGKQHFLQIANHLTQYFPGGYKYDYDKMTIGTAVGASSCVPGLFPPLGIKLESSVLSLVDGGISDNSGVLSLIEEKCNYIIISDGSLYMDNINQPSDSLSGIFFRTNDIFMEHLKKHIIKTAEKHTDNVILLSIRQELEDRAFRYVDGKIPLTEYGINHLVQHFLSKTRTDLDSFSEIEAKSLMSCGMLITKNNLKSDTYKNAIMSIIEEVQESSYIFNFEDDFIIDSMKNPTEKYLKFLNAASQRIWKKSKFRTNPYNLYRIPTKHFRISKLTIFYIIISAIITIFFGLKSSYSDAFYYGTVFQLSVLFILLVLFFKLYVPILFVLAVIIIHFDDIFYQHSANRYYKKNSSKAWKTTLISRILSFIKKKKKIDFTG